MSVYTGGSVTFTMTKTDATDPKFQWQKRSGNTWTNVGLDNSTFTTTNAKHSDAGEYRCEVTVGGASCATGSVKLSVFSPPAQDPRPDATPDANYPSEPGGGATVSVPFLYAGAGMDVILIAKDADGNPVLRQQAKLDSGGVAAFTIAPARSPPASTR